MKQQELMSKVLHFINSFETWEANLIMCAEAWSGSYPTMTQELYDEYMTVQKERNELKKYLLQKGGCGMESRHAWLGLPESRITNPSKIGHCAPYNAQSICPLAGAATGQPPQ